MQKNISLLSYNTFKIDVSSDYFVVVRSEEDFMDLMKLDIFRDNKKLILWWGSNILLLWDFHGLAIKNEILWKEIINNNLLDRQENKQYNMSKEIIIRVWAGENWDGFVRWCVDKMYSGLENLVDIPGSVGAAPMQNIGAYGVEAGMCIKSVEWIFLDDYLDYKKGDVGVIIDAKFGYRTSIFKQELKGKFFITHVVFVLQRFSENYRFNLSYNWIKRELDSNEIKESELTLLRFVNIVSKIRENKLPDREKIGTAGSFFKNPVISKEKYDKLKIKFPDLIWFSVEDGIKLVAWQLIQACDLKGKTDGCVGTYKKHALILVNHGGATWQDVRKFAQYIQDCVLGAFGVDIEPEVNYIVGES